MDEHNAVVDERDELLRQCEAAVKAIEDARQVSGTRAFRNAALGAVNLVGPLYAMYMDHWGAETWFTTCTGCAATLDRSYAETVRAEKAEALNATLVAALLEARTSIMRLNGEGRQALLWGARMDVIGVMDVIRVAVHDADAAIAAARAARRRAAAAEAAKEGSG